MEGPSLSASICTSRHHVCRHAGDQPLEPTYVFQNKEIRHCSVQKKKIWSHYGDTICLKTTIRQEYIKKSVGN